MNQVFTPKFGIGAPVRRMEDQAFVTGTGQYVADITPAGTVCAYVLRSPIAHAKMVMGSLDDARAAEGVHLILTAADVADLGNLPTTGMAKQVDGSFPTVPPRPLLCSDIVRHVGDPIAFVVADTLDAAKSAAELIELDFDPLDVVVDTEAALADGAPLVWPELGSNKAFEFGLGDKDRTDAIFAEAEIVSTTRIVNNRVVCNYMETRGCLGEYDAAEDRYTITTGTQGGHKIQGILAEHIFKTDPSKFRVITPDVGGAFGTKNFVFHEHPLCLVAAKRLGRPVKWICERTEHFLIDPHGRDHVSTASFAMNKDGRILAMKVDFIAAMGAYLSQFGPFIPWLAVTMATGTYAIDCMHVRCIGSYTNTTPTDAYRGAGRPEGAYLIERLVDVAARDSGLSVAEFRRRNFVQPDAMPYRTQAGRNYDSGEYAAHMDEAMLRADWDGFEVRLAESRKAGKYRGIGMATYVEACAFAGSEPANLVLDETGLITLLIGTQTGGQGHATAYGQVVADVLGITLDQYECVQGDTDRVLAGGGTGGSRSIPIGLPSVEVASKTLSKQIKEIAADTLEVSVSDLELVDGTVRVVGTDRSMTLSEVARATDDADKLKANGEVKQDEATYPNGTHICELEVDPETGATTIDRYTIVDDFGVIVNPLLLAGQVHGGAAQGIGQAFMESTVYDESGQLLSGSFMDYQMPRAADIPSFDFQTRNVPSPTNAMGIKGAGEAGSIGSSPCVMNALADALWRGCGVPNIDMPATPVRIWEAIQAAKG